MRQRLRALSSDRLLLALIAATAGLAVWYATGPSSRTVQVVTAWVFIASMHACLIWITRSFTRTPGLPAPILRFWRAVLVGAIAYLAGDLAQVVLAATQPGLPSAATGGTIRTATLSAGSAWLLLALLASPLGLATRRARLRFWLDVATVMVAAVVVGWYLVAPDRPADLLSAAAPVLTGPVILLLCVFAVAKLTMSGTALFTRACAVIGTTAAAIKAGADLLICDGLDPRRLHWFLAMTIAANAGLTIAARVTQMQLARNPLALDGPRVRRPYSLLPYGAIVVTYGLLTVAIWRNEAATVPIALTGAAISTLLVVLRQLDAFHENAQLLAKLHCSLDQRETLAARLQHQAFHDGLTGLPNRQLYSHRLDAALAAGAPAVVMLIDLDDFKLVNDAHGHAAGDHLLKVIADRMRACVRSSDTVSRIGGDEFAVLLSSLPGDDALEIAARIVREIEAPVPVDGGAARVGASVGIAFARPGPAGHLPDGEALLREADHAMYAVKRDGKGSYAVSPG
ncbi:diguanylate cyclase domain-containing protein [Amorphoplanes digitatis]|uniref:Diguanylate cyclase (GGDEF)-like protein n=1 Tax=Actinoplanes digitatis TaxID=1868 RepID=A0A7W7MNJ2_9ACTN|nr:diguanylate cyclase [Actinoplanes digitatis]MBB4761046.1 diguanylate cyclase (GGDEF)-like protein [Actinoplanes digitatis]